MTLDYLVNKTKPWTVYAQASNTGTEQTKEWRERFGFIDNQLTNHDDVQSIDYTTAGFDSSNDVQGSYEASRFRICRTCVGRFTGAMTSSWHRTSGSRVKNSRGTITRLGAEAIVNIYQDKAYFVDAVGGMRWQDVEVENSANTPSKARGDFVLPYVAALAGGEEHGGFELAGVGDVSGRV